MKIEIWEPLETEYKPKVIALAESIRAEMISEDWEVSEVSDWTDEDLAVNFIYYPEGDKTEETRNRAIDITFRLMDAQAWDGEENGTSFSVDITGIGGEMIGGLHPFNYSDQCWVDPTNAQAVKERWEVFEQAASDANEIMYAIEKWVKARAERTVPNA